MNDKTVVWLKIFYKPEKETLLSVFKHLDFWINTFSSDTEKYHICIYNENVELPKQYYDQFEIVNRKKLIEKSNEVSWLNDQIKNSKIIDPIWKPAAFALLAPYFYSKSKYLWNIDASDIIWPGDTNENIDKVFEVLQKYSLPVISSDIYLSVPNFSWSFGITLVEVEQMKELVKLILPLPVQSPGWKTNIDHMFSCYLLGGQYNYSYVSFTSKDYFMHEGGVGKGLCSRWDEEKGVCECDLYGKEKKYGRKNVKSILI